MAVIRPVIHSERSRFYLFHWNGITVFEAVPGTGFTTVEEDIVGIPLDEEADWFSGIICIGRIQCYPARYFLHQIMLASSKGQQERKDNNDLFHKHLPKRILF